MKHFENNDMLHGFMKACGCSAQQKWPSAAPQANHGDPTAPLQLQDSISFWYASRRGDLTQALALKNGSCDIEMADHFNLTLIVGYKICLLQL